MYKLIFLLLFSFLLTTFLIKKLIPVLDKRLIDKPNKRSSHKIPTPKGGGISFVIVSSIFSFLNGNYNLLFLIPISFLGLMDDKYNLPRNIRYLIQFLTSLIFIFSSQLFLESFYNQNLILLILLFFVFTFLASGIINFVNFMDGIDGLVAGCMTVLISYSAFFIDINLLIIAVSIFAFLIWNWSPAKLFMGDIGSLFLGGLFVYILSKSQSWELLFSLFMISTPLILDPLFCLYKRFKSKKNIFNPHREHLYQRMNQFGLSHSLVSSIYIFVTLLLALFHYLGGIKLLFVGLLLELITGFFANKFCAMTCK